MNEEQSLAIVASLAKGSDPATGRAAADISMLQRPEVTHALALACQALEQAALKHKRATHQPANAGKPWTPEHDTSLQQSFGAGTKVVDLASQLGRSKAAIEARLVFHGLMEPASASHRLRF